MAISWVAAVCSSTAVAIVATISLTPTITSEIWPMPSSVVFEVFWTSSMRFLISSVASAVCLASSLISLATTANPLPASPARAASMVALSASRLVCSEISVMVSVTLPILPAASPSCCIMVVALPAWVTASEETPLAFSAFSAISLIVELICSAAVATILALVADSSMAAATLLRLALISSAAVATLVERCEVSSALESSSPEISVS